MARAARPARRVRRMRSLQVKTWAAFVSSGRRCPAAVSAVLLHRRPKHNRPAAPFTPAAPASILVSGPRSPSRRRYHAMRIRSRLLRQPTFVLLGLAFLAAVPAPAAENNAEAAAAAPRNALKRDVIYLASDELEGRGPATKGIEKAADYIAGEFKKAGLKPGGVDGTYFQPFPYPANILDEPARLSLKGPKGQEIELKAGAQFNPMGLGHAGKLTAPRRLRRLRHHQRRGQVRRLRRHRRDGQGRRRPPRRAAPRQRGNRRPAQGVGAAEPQDRQRREAQGGRRPLRQRRRHGQDRRRPARLQLHRRPAAGLQPAGLPRPPLRAPDHAHGRRRPATWPTSNAASTTTPSRTAST